MENINRLNPSKVDTLKNGMHGDGGYLWLRVKGASRGWTVRGPRIDGKKQEVFLGSVSRVSLAQARRERDKLVEAWRNGKNPVAEKRAAKEAAAKQKTFAEVAQLVVVDMKRWRVNRDTGRQTSLDRWNRAVAACEAIASKPVADISLDDVKGIVLQLEKETPIAARQVLNVIAEVLGYAIGNELRTTVNYAAPDAAKHWMRARPEKVGHAALHYAKAPAFLAAVRASGADSSDVLEFAILTAARSGEARGARWSEIELEARTWTVPKAGMKKGREHIVPLSDQAIAVLERAKAQRVGEYVFPGFELHSRTVRADKVMSNQTVHKLVERLSEAFEVDVTTHGFRSTFRNWAAERGISDNVAEFALAHVKTGVEGAYFTTTMIADRGRAMQAWADYLDGAAADNVVPFKAAA